MIELNPVGFFDLHSKLLARLAEVVVDVVGHLKVRALLAVLVNHDPFLTSKVDSLLNRQLAEHVLIHVNDLTTLKNLRSGHDARADLNRCLLNRDVPIFESLLAHKLAGHPFDFVHFLFRRNVRLLEGKAHGLAFLHAVGDTVNEAELRGQVVDLVRDLNDEQGLVHVSEHLVVDILEVSSQADLLAVVREHVLQGARRVVDVLHEVAPAISPVCDDRLVAKLEFGHLLSLVLALVLLLDFHKTV